MQLAIVSLVYRMLQMLAHAVRHYVLELAHPTPTYLQIYPGVPNSLHRRLVIDVVDACSIAEVELVETPERTRPTLWIDGDAPVEGCMAVCRYLGRLMRLLPVNPVSCARVDASLELLQSFVHAVTSSEEGGGEERASRVAVFASLLEDSFESHASTKHMDGFNADTLADVCWAAAWKHVVDGSDVPSVEEYPNLRSWMAHQNVVAREDDESDTTIDTDVDVDADSDVGVDADVNAKKDM